MIYRAAIFDLDGVIADTARLHLAAWQQLAEELKLPWPEDTEERLKGLERMASLEVILGEQGRKFSKKEKHSLASRKNKRYQALIRSLSPRDLLPGARELMDWLNKSEIPIALASASKNAPAVLHALGISNYFSFIADPEQSAPKPSADIFLAAAHGLQVEPDLCVAFEDACAGIAAIKAAEGMTAIGVGCKSALGSADYIVSSLEEFAPKDFFLSEIKAAAIR
ncbi:beta-phosphoglucomutase [Microbulbifer echini]|uniref:Beta-phosphoglucomutase n=1 Tax=Microbulbifer echini TaxID=1529067 RepID=A0ABV4NNC1_9GAMM